MLGRGLGTLVRPCRLLDVYVEVRPAAPYKYSFNLASAKARPIAREEVTAELRDEVGPIEELISGIEAMWDRTDVASEERLDDDGRAPDGDELLSPILREYDWCMCPYGSEERLTFALSARSSMEANSCSRQASVTVR